MFLDAATNRSSGTNPLLLRRGKFRVNVVIVGHARFRDGDSRRKPWARYPRRGVSGDGANMTRNRKTKSQLFDVTYHVVTLFWRAFGRKDG